MGRTITSLPKRTRRVKALLSLKEIDQLDQIARDMGLDRSSAIRHLLVSFVSSEDRHADAGAEKTREKQVKKIKVTDKGTKQIKPSIKLCEPKIFDELTTVVCAIRDGFAVVLNVTMMEPDQAQRAVDFVAGATFYGDGRQERVGESIFLFAPQEFEVHRASESIENSSEDRKLISSDLGDSPQSGESVVTSRDAAERLTELQSNVLEFVHGRWEKNHETTPLDIIEGKCSNEKPGAAIRLARRVLNSLARNGLVEITQAGETISVKPVVRGSDADALIEAKPAVPNAKSLRSSEEDISLANETDPDIVENDESNYTAAHDDARDWQSDGGA